MKSGRFGLSMAALLLLGLPGCGEEGSAEKAGREVDEAVRELEESGEGALERAGRETDEAVKETREAVEALTEEAEKK
jgi:hyperosmotically inducible protein